LSLRGRCALAVLHVAVAADASGLTARAQLCLARGICGPSSCVCTGRRAGVGPG
jgi:hypothetical protein